MKVAPQAENKKVSPKQIGCLVIIVIAIIAILLWVRSKRKSDTDVDAHPAVKVINKQVHRSSIHYTAWYKSLV